MRELQGFITKISFGAGIPPCPLPTTPLMWCTFKQDLQNQLSSLTERYIFWFYSGKKLMLMLDENELFSARSEVWYYFNDKKKRYSIDSEMQII